METPERLLLFSTPNPHPELSSPENTRCKGFLSDFHRDYPLDGIQSRLEG